MFPNLREFKITLCGPSPSFYHLSILWLLHVNQNQSLVQQRVEQRAQDPLTGTSKYMKIKVLQLLLSAEACRKTKSSGLILTMEPSG